MDGILDPQEDQSNQRTLIVPRQEEDVKIDN